MQNVIGFLPVTPRLVRSCRWCVSLALVWLGAIVSCASAADRFEAVKFKRGATSATLSGTIRGYDSVRYFVGAVAGQVMSVLFSPSNRSCYMNVWTPGADATAFNGAIIGNEYAANLTVSGNYAIQVYLMRSAARRNENCRYWLREAAVMYGVQPAQIATSTVRRSPSGFEIDGTADKGAEGIKKLRCIFNAGRTFDHIMAMTPDGE